jgi:predicted AAA+ superfamily ATPase
MKRSINVDLLDWKDSISRKVLLVRGARQVGKTYSVRELGKSYEHYLEVNLEEEKQVHFFFEETLNPEVICENLEAFYNVPIIPGKTLLFFDEVQACLPAIQSLRFFYEKMPGLHVIAAGSLLEFALKEIPTFGVGRIRSIYMYPLTFDEFLSANGEEAIIILKDKATPRKPLPVPIHNKLVGLLKKYLIIGGMPEVVKIYRKTRNIRECQLVLDDLLNSYYDDFSKYKERVPANRIRDVFNSIAKQSGNKFILNKASTYSNHLQIKDALEMLILAGLAYKVNHTSGNGIPLGAEINDKKFKMILFDIGVQQRLLNLDLNEQLTNNKFDSINKGNVAEQMVGLELIKNSAPNIKPHIYYWHRESRSSNAEIDYLVQKNERIIPIEVKAGTKGQMQSMFLFLKEKRIKKGIRQSLENFSEYDMIDVFPIYAVKNIIK